jgi:enamine deaminase RidA (YjgF/YER057c/UK114 family)
VGYKPDQLPILREVRAEMLKDLTPPASTLVGVQGLVNPDLLIEIEAIAVID